MMSNNGLFITFEGLDGAGKSTQIKEVYQYLVKNGYKAISTSEPRGTAIGRGLSRLLFSDKVKQFDKITEALVFNAARRENIVRVIAPALRKGYIVLCDRFADSTLAMQGLNSDVKALNQIACGECKPDLTFFIDLSEKICDQRIRSRGITRDRFENSGLSRFRAIRRNYWELWEAEPQRIKMVNGRLPIEEQKQIILKVILDELEKQKNRS